MSKFSTASPVILIIVNCHSREALPVETMGGSPMDMMQYYRLFGTTRIPAEGKDKMSYNPNSKHIVVLHRNHVSVLMVME